MAAAEGPAHRLMGVVLTSGEVTFLFTDVEGSTALLRAVGEQHFADVLERHREIVVVFEMRIPRRGRQHRPVADAADATNRNQHRMRCGAAVRRPFQR
jgi:hypothetical protein